MPVIQNLHHVALVQALTVTGRNEHGEEVTAWTTQKTSRCRLEPLSQREYWQAQQVQPETVFQCWMRYDADINEETRLVIEGVNYHLSGPPLLFPEGKKQWMKLLVKKAQE